MKDRELQLVLEQLEKRGIDTKQEIGCQSFDEILNAVNGTMKLEALNGLKNMLPLGDCENAEHNSKILVAYLDAVNEDK